MLAKASYPALVYFHDGAYEAIFFDLDGCYATGYTIKELWENSKKALNAYCAFHGHYPMATRWDQIEIPAAAFLFLVEAPIKN